jgi:hypothetical protein
MFEPQAKCALCDAPLSAVNDSREHIIANALGGRRTASGFICKPCNNTSGHRWDAALAKQLNSLSLFFAIKRQHGDPPAQEFATASGGAIRVGPNGLAPIKPTVTRKPIETGTNIQVVVRTMAEAKEILSGLKKKHPQIDVDAILASATPNRTYLDEPLKFDLAIGGPDAGRSIVKSAFALAVASGVSPSDCDEAKRYLASGEDGCFGYYYERDLLETRPANTVVHCVAVHSTHGGLLLGYVELFSGFRMVVCLATAYSGQPINAVYSIDPVSGSELDVAVSLNFSQEDLKDIFAYQRIPDGAMAQAMGEVIPIGLKRSFEKERTAVINRAVAYAWSKLDAEPGSLLTPEHVAQLSAMITDQISRSYFMVQQRRLAVQSSVLPPPEGSDPSDA